MNIELGLIGTGLSLGLRHGVDWDHIAAITDVTGTQTRRAKAILLGNLYALGHASVVVALGLTALWAGSTIPSSVDSVMETVVGLTLILLGLWLSYTLWRDGTNYRMRSRWMLVFDQVRRLIRWLDTKFSGSVHEHPHTPRTQNQYSLGTAYLIGMVHGVGAETGSQMLLFAAAAGATSDVSGTLLLGAFVGGLLCSNLMITLFSVMGFTGSRRYRVVYMGLGIVTAAFSLTVGVTILLFGSSIFPSLLT